MLIHSVIHSVKFYFIYHSLSFCLAFVLDISVREARWLRIKIRRLSSHGLNRTFCCHMCQEDMDVVWGANTLKIYQYHNIFNISFRFVTFFADIGCYILLLDITSYSLVNILFLETPLYPTPYTLSHMTSKVHYGSSGYIVRTRMYCSAILDTKLWMARLSK